MGPVTCPTADGTTYAVPETNAQYKITCRAAPAGGDIASFEAATFAECLGLCAKTQGCVGVSCKHFLVFFIPSLRRDYFPSRTHYYFVPVVLVS